MDLEGLLKPTREQSSCVWVEVLCWKELQPLTAVEAAEDKWEMEISQKIDGVKAKGWTAPKRIDGGIVSLSRGNKGGQNPSRR